MLSSLSGASMGRSGAGCPAGAVLAAGWFGGVQVPASLALATASSASVTAPTGWPWRSIRGVPAVIAGEPLQRALANHFQVKPRTIAEADWTPCLALAGRLDTLANCLGVDVFRLLKPFRHGWAAGLHTLTHQVGTRLNVDALFEMMQAAWHYGVRPALADWATSNGLDESAVPLQPPPAFFPRWFGRSGLARLMTLAREWRTARLTFSLARSDAAPETAEPLTWLAWTPGSHTSGDYRILELTSQTDLEHEGLRLAHCVGTYAGECLLRSMGIYAVRDRHGQSCSTFEVQMTESGPLLFQHQATANTDPHP